MRINNPQDVFYYGSKGISGLLLGSMVISLLISCKTKQGLPAETPVESVDLPWIGDRQVVYMEANITYYINKSYSIGRPVRIIGAQNSAIKAPPNSPNARLRFLDNVELENIRFDGVSVNIIGRNGSGAIRRCTFANQTYPPMVITEGAHDVLIDSCRFTGEYRGEQGVQNFPGIEIRKGAHDIIVSECKFIDNISGITADGMDDYIENIVVLGNEFRGYKYYGVKFDVGDHYVVQNNTFAGEKGHSINGIFFETMDIEGRRRNNTSGTDLKVVGNTFENLQYAVRSVGGANPNSAILFTENVVQDCAIGIYRSASSLQITGNTFRNGHSIISYDSEVNKTGDTEIRNNIISGFQPVSTGIQRRRGVETALNCIICLNNLSYAEKTGKVVIAENNIEASGGNFVSILGTQKKRIELEVFDNTFDGNCSINRLVFLNDDLKVSVSDNYRLTDGGAAWERIIE